MPKLARLYLDTARLGLMSPSAQLAARDFARLAGEGVSTLYFRRFLQRGLDGRQARSHQFPGLAAWQGIARFQQSLRQLLNLPPESPVWLASRTSSLVLQTCHLLARRCRNVLVADILWPPYQRILQEQCLERGCQVTTFALRDAMFSTAGIADEILDRLADAYQAHGCDGVFLSSISHDGLRLPVAPLLRRLRAVCRVQLAVIDGAQELAHAPVDLCTTGADVYLAGCHKWFGAHLPLGICCLARAQTCEPLIREFHDAEQRLGQVDPLLSFLASLAGQTANSTRTETVNLMPLVCAAGAMDDLLAQESTLAASLTRRLDNLLHVARMAEQQGWTAKLPPTPFRSGILLLESHEPDTCALSADVLQDRLDATGITLTAYDGGRLRLSMPDRPFAGCELTQIEHALATGQGGAASNGRTTRRRSGRASTGTSGWPAAARL